MIHRTQWLVVALVAVAGLAAAALAQTPDAPAAAASGLDAETGALPTIQALFMTSPIINGCIALLSLIAVLLFLYFFVTINPGSMAPTTFVDEVGKLVINRKYEEAANLCRANPRVFVASVIQRCAENAGKEHSVIMDMVDSEGRRRADIIWNRISYLADIANVAPMLGLLGTVYGMMLAFFGMKFQALSVEAGGLTESIAIAMTTTFFGLIVAIVASIFYTLIKARATRSLANAEQIVHSVADHIKRGGA